MRGWVGIFDGKIRAGELKKLRDLKDIVKKWLKFLILAYLVVKFGRGLYIKMQFKFQLKLRRLWAGADEFKKLSKN